MPSLEPAKLRKHRIARDGGLIRTMQCLGLQNKNLTSDAILVCIDLEVYRKEREQPGTPLVNEFGIATFDCRHLKSSTAPLQYISTRQFSTYNASKDFYGCDATNFDECLFAETFRVEQLDLPATIIKCLRIRDDQALDHYKLRNIIIVGHSIRCDLKILQRIGVNIRDIAPVLAIVDTHFIAHHLSATEGFTPAKGFSLGSLLTEFGCPFKKSDLHNAGNDATFTLHLLLKISIKASDGYDLDENERETLQRLRAAVQFELHERPHWKPQRESLGFYRIDSD